MGDPGKRAAADPIGIEEPLEGTTDLHPKEEIITGRRDA
jgi:hypothetical protein